MKQKPKITYNEIKFDSKEELEFYWWCEEAKEHGIIKDFIYHDFNPIVLSEKTTYYVEKKLKTKTKVIEKTVFREHSYKHDFEIELFEGVNNIFKTIHNKRYAFIDVKGTFQQNDGQRSFSINQKWVYAKLGIYIEKIIPKEFFKKTWVPEKARYTPKTKKLRTTYAGYKTIDDYLEVI